MKAKSKNRRCKYCSESFKPSTGRQIYCKRPKCSKDRKYEYWVEYIEQWKKSHPGYWQNYLRKWRKDHPDYFKEWRRKHPDYFRNWYRKRKAMLSKSGKAR